MRYPRGGAARTQSHPNEQFTFVLEGLLWAEIDGEALLADKHCIVHVPAGTPHALSAQGSRDALVVTVQDTRHGFAA